MPYVFQCPLLENITYPNWNYDRYENEEITRERRIRKRKNEVFITERERRVFTIRPRQIKVRELYTRPNYENTIVPNLKRVFLTIKARDYKLKLKNSNSNNQEILHPDIVKQYFEKYGVTPISYLKDILREKQTLIVILYLIQEIGIDMTINILEYF